MSNFAKGLTVLAALVAMTANSVAGELPVWAYPVADSGVEAARDDGQVQHVPNSTVALTRKQIEAHGSAVPDWHPEEHPVMPGIVAKGREPQVWACGYCHLPSGAGRPENASLAGLTPAYIRQQLIDFRNGDRPGSEPKRAPQAFMIALAKAATDAEVTEAANYFATIKPACFIKVVEVTAVPKTFVAGAMLARAPGGDMEPIGNRIIEVPEELGRAENRDSRTPYLAYVPVGSLQKGAELVLTGGGGQTQLCAACHGPDLKGLADVPRLAGRSPSYLMRQLYDVRHGTRTGLSSVPMKAVVANLTEEDMVAIAAYLASREP